MSVVAPDTDKVLAPVKSKVDPEPIINVVAESGVPIVTLLEIVGDAIVTELVPEMDCAFVVKETTPAPDRLKVPPLVIPPRNSKGAAVAHVKPPVPFTVTLPMKSLLPLAAVTSKVPVIFEVVETVKTPVLLFVNVTPEPMVRILRVIEPVPEMVWLPVKVVVPVPRFNRRVEFCTNPF